MSTPQPQDDLYLNRLARARRELESQGVDALLVALGSDVPYLVGASIMPSERLTVLVLRRAGRPVMIVPKLEAALMPRRPEVFELRPWADGEDPMDLLDRLLADDDKTVAFGDQSRAQHLISLLQRRPGLEVRHASEVLAPLISVKDESEQTAMAVASAAADRVIAAVQTGRVPLIGRTEMEVSRQLAEMLIEEGHQKVLFTLVASGPNAASPHHHSGERRIRPGEAVLFDIGGVLDGYCSDITRCVHLGAPPAEYADAYAVLMEAQAAATTAATVGTPCGEIDRAARRVIEQAGYGDYFIHRTGHGIGMSVHEDPYITEGSSTPLQAGNCFSIEPGIYLPERWGMRLENLVVATPAGPKTLNQVPRNLVVLDA